MVEFVINGRVSFVVKQLASLLNVLAYNIQYSENDGLIIIDGKEGGGKSVLSRQIGGYMAYLLKTKFSMDNISFTLKDYVKRSLKGGVGRVNILDESREALNRRRGMSKENVAFGNFLSECRILRQVHIIVLPRFHDLEHYVAEHRMNLLVHVIITEEQVKSVEDGGIFGEVVKLKRGQFIMYKRTPLLIECYRNTRDRYPRQLLEYYGTFGKSETLTPDDMLKYTAEKKDKLHSYYDVFDESKTSKTSKSPKTGLTHPESVERIPEVWFGR